MEDDQRCLRTSLTIPTSVIYPRQSEGPLDHWTSEWLTIHTPPPRNQLVHPKDPIPMDQHTGMVYQIPCSECVGQSGRTLKHCLSEHRQALQSGDVALAEHVRMAHRPLC